MIYDRYKRKTKPLLRRIILVEAERISGLINFSTGAYKRGIM